MAKRQMKRPQIDSRARSWQIALTFLAAIFIVFVMLYGLNNSNEPNSSSANAPPIPITPQSASIPQNGQPNQQTAQQQGQSQKLGGTRPLEPSSSQPNGPGKPSTTTGQADH